MDAASGDVGGLLRAAHHRGRRLPLPCAGPVPETLGYPGTKVPDPSTNRFRVLLEFVGGLR